MADIYFCPEWPGAHFGSFYMKGAPAMDHEGYTIDTELTAVAGKALCDAAECYVTSNQAVTMSKLVDIQRDNLYAGSTNIVSVRRQIATLLCTLRSVTDSDGSIPAQVLGLSGTYGRLDGENNYNYASTFAFVYQSLTTSQRTRLAALHASIMTGMYDNGTPFEFTECDTPCLYSSAMSDTETLASYIDDATTDAFFE